MKFPYDFYKSSSYMDPIATTKNLMANALVVAVGAVSVGLISSIAFKALGMTAVGSAVAVGGIAIGAVGVVGVLAGAAYLGRDEITSALRVLFACP